jgi:hypothetical protein
MSNQHLHWSELDTEFVKQVFELLIKDRPDHKETFEVLEGMACTNDLDLDILSDLESTYDLLGIKYHNESLYNQKGCYVSNPDRASKSTKEYMKSKRETSRHCLRVVRIIKSIRGDNNAEDALTCLAHGVRFVSDDLMDLIDRHVKPNTGYTFVKDTPHD